MTDMRDKPLPDRGAIVTYVPQSGQSGHGPFARAVATGPAIMDPSTDQAWIPIRRPDRMAVLLDPGRVIDIVPPVPGNGQ